MGLDIEAWVGWKTNGTQHDRTLPVMAIGFGDSKTVWNLLSDRTGTQLEVETFMKEVARSGMISLFVPKDAAMLTFPQGREVEFLELRIKRNGMALAEPLAHELKVTSNVPWALKGPVVRGNRVSVEDVSFGGKNVVVLKLPKGRGFKL